LPPRAEGRDQPAARLRLEADSEGAGWAAALCSRSRVVVPGPLPRPPALLSCLPLHRAATRRRPCCSSRCPSSCCALTSEPQPATTARRPLLPCLPGRHASLPAARATLRAAHAPAACNSCRVSQRHATRLFDPPSPRGFPAATSPSGTTTWCARCRSWRCTTQGAARCPQTSTRRRRCERAARAGTQSGERGMGGGRGGGAHAACPAGLREGISRLTSRPGLAAPSYPACCAGARCGSTGASREMWPSDVSHPAEPPSPPPPSSPPLPRLRVPVNAIFRRTDCRGVMLREVSTPGPPHAVFLYAQSTPTLCRTLPF
jgi:hypothetical protein